MAKEGVGFMKIVAVGGEIALKTKTANIADVSGYDGLFFYVYTEAESAPGGRAIRRSPQGSGRKSRCLSEMRKAG